jgi:hypothetical protein
MAPSGQKPSQILPNFVPFNPGFQPWETLSKRQQNRHFAFLRPRRRAEAESTESISPGKRSSRSWRRRELMQTTPCGSIRITPASRSTLKWREAVDLLSSNGISQQFSPSVPAIARTIFRRVGSLSAKRTPGRVIWFFAGWSGIRIREGNLKRVQLQCSLINELSRRSPFAVRRSPFAVRRSPFAVRRSPFAVRRSAGARPTSH